MRGRSMLYSSTHTKFFNNQSHILSLVLLLNTTIKQKHPLNSQYSLKTNSSFLDQSDRGRCKLSPLFSVVIEETDCNIQCWVMLESG